MRVVFTRSLSPPVALSRSGNSRERDSEKSTLMHTLMICWNNNETERSGVSPSN